MSTSQGVLIINFKRCYVKRLVRTLVSFLKDLWVVLWFIPTLVVAGLFLLLLTIAVGSDAVDVLRKLGRRL